MAANSGDLAQSLIEGGLAPAAARIIANALANAASPQLSAGGDRVDSTPRQNLRLITPDTRKYQLTNLDYTPSQPFQQRIDDLSGRYDPAAIDHPYKDSQPVSPTPPIAQPSVRGKDYIEVTNLVENNSNVAEVSLDIRLDVGGRHIRLDPSTRSLESTPFVASSESPKYLFSEFKETEKGTELLQSLRNLATVNVALADGSSRQMVAFSEGDAVENGAFAVGNWTPSFSAVTISATLVPTAAATQPTIAYGTQWGRWIRLGKLIHAYGQLYVNSISGGTGADGLMINGLPVAAAHPFLKDRPYIGVAGQVAVFGATKRPNAVVAGYYNFNTSLFVRYGARTSEYVTVADLSTSNVGATMAFNIWYESGAAPPVGTGAGEVVAV